MKSETYLWIAAVVIIIIAALLFRYLYQPAIDISISVHGSVPVQMYPYQKATLGILAANNGTAAIQNMSLGVFVNGNLSTLYKVTLPAGKQTTIYYNYSPTASGTYSISVQADPAKVYDIADRAASTGNFSFSVDAASAADPQSLLPGNATYTSERALSAGGYVTSSYIYDNYGVSRFAPLPSGQAGRFIEPVLNVTYNYIVNMSAAEAQYGNASAYSLWIKGYLAPSIFSVAATGTKFTSAYINSAAGNITLISMPNHTSFCSWYAQGWLKVLTVSSNSASCVSLVNASSTANVSAHENSVASEFGSRLVPTNAVTLGRFYGSDRLGSYAASLYYITNESFDSEMITNQSTSSNVCYGVIGSYDNASYCSTYLVPLSGKFGNTSLIETTAYRGGYNVSAFSFVKTSDALKQVPVAESLLSALNVTGPSLSFISGITNTCSLGAAFGCSNLTYDNGTVSFVITSMLNASAHINSAGCYTYADDFPSPENATLAPGASYPLSTRCYNITTPITGIALNLHADIGINYTVGNATHDDIGTAFIPFG